MATRSSIIVLNLLLLFGPSLQAANCYYPDGTFAEFDSPCFPDQAESICCGQGHTCMSNNLCRWPDSEMTYPLAYIRGSCTDSSWNSTECGDVCKAVYPSEWDPIIACPGAEFCCELDSYNPSSCCNLTNTTAHPFYTLAAASTVTVIGSSSATSSLSSFSPTTTSISPISIPTNNGSSNRSSNTGTKIGLGVGIGGGVVLILAGIAVFFCLRKRRGARENETRPDMQPALVHEQMQVQDTVYQKAELPVSVPSYVEHNNMPKETVYEKGRDRTAYSELGPGQRLPEMP